jgi:hypothetical protein
LFAIFISFFSARSTGASKVRYLLDVRTALLAVITEVCAVKKPESYSFTEAAALPMSALVAYGAVKVQSSSGSSSIVECLL